MESAESIGKKKLPGKNPVNDMVLILVSFAIPTIIGLIIDITYLYDSVYLGGPTFLGILLGAGFAFTAKGALVRRDIEALYKQNR